MTIIGEGRVLRWVILGVSALLLGPSVFYFGYVAVNAINCPDEYDPDVADFCGWRPPDKDAVVVPPRWDVVATTDELACGSGGCMYRAWVLEGTESSDNPMQDFLAAAQAAGWSGEDAADGAYLKRQSVCLRPFPPSDIDEWKTYDVAEHALAGADRRVMVVGNLVNGGARWDGPRPPTKGPLQDQCAIGL